MSTIYNRIRHNFSQVSNVVLLDDNLSSKAKAMYWYMCYRMGICEEWEFNEIEILKHFKEKRDAMRDAKNELIDGRYLVKVQRRNSKGFFGPNDYEIFAEPQPVEAIPSPENPSTGEPSSGKPSTGNTSYNNKEKNNKDYINKDYSSSNPPPKEFFQNIKEKENYGCDVGDYISNRIRTSGWEKIKGEKGFKEDFKFWEEGWQKKKLKNNPVTDVGQLEDPEISTIRRKIKTSLPLFGDYDKFFAGQPIEKTGNCFAIKVSDKKALEYHEILSKIDVRIEYDS